MQHLTMIGHQLKYEPAFASQEQRKLMSTLNVSGNIKSLAGKIV
jgi:hypothetical protein